MAIDYINTRLSMRQLVTLLVLLTKVTSPVQSLLTDIAIQDLTVGWFTPGLIYIFEGHSRSINDIIIYCVLSSLYMLFRFNARNMFIDHDSLHKHFSVLTSFTTIKQMVSNVFIQLSTPVIIKFSMIHLEFEIYKQPINLLLYILYIYMLYS